MLTPRQAIIAATAGPENWGNLTSSDHADTKPENAYPLLNTALRQHNTTLDSSFTSLSALAGATLILTHSIATHSPRGALSIYRACKRKADSLNTIEGATRVEYKDATRAINKILYRDDPLAHTMLLVDVIRIANHITKG